LEYYIVTSPANALTYGATPLTALNNPLQQEDLAGFGRAPTAGATVNGRLAGTTLWWNNAGDYSAFGLQSPSAPISSTLPR
jgi:hypothetical protein